MIRIRLLVLLAMPLIASACTGGNGDSSDQGLLLVLAAATNPCLITASPELGSGLSTNDLAGTNTGSIVGSVMTSSGEPGVNALVIVDDSDPENSVHYSTYSGINRDGSFEISGIEAGSYTVAVESIDMVEFADRIDYHIDCFVSPRDFTSGWYTGDKNTISQNKGDGVSVTVNDGGVTDIGSIVLIE